MRYLLLLIFVLLLIGCEKGPTDETDTGVIEADAGVIDADVSVADTDTGVADASIDIENN